MGRHLLPRLPLLPALCRHNLPLRHMQHLCRWVGGRAVRLSLGEQCLLPCQVGALRELRSPCRAPPCLFLAPTPMPAPTPAPTPTPTPADLWICLICGHVGCGRYRGSHAAGHWQESGHGYALELETQVGLCFVFLGGGRGVVSFFLFWEEGGTGYALELEAQVWGDGGHCLPCPALPAYLPACLPA